MTNTVMQKCYQALGNATWRAKYSPIKKYWIRQLPRWVQVDKRKSSAGFTLERYPQTWRQAIGYNLAVHQDSRFHCWELTTGLSISFKREPSMIIKFLFLYPLTCVYCTLPMSYISSPFHFIFFKLWSNVSISDLCWP